MDLARKTLADTLGGHRVLDLYPPAPASVPEEEWLLQVLAAMIDADIDVAFLDAFPRMTAAAFRLALAFLKAGRVWAIFLPDDLDTAQVNDLLVAVEASSVTHMGGGNLTLEMRQRFLRAMTTNRQSSHAWRVSEVDMEGLHSIFSCKDMWIDPMDRRENSFKPRCAGCGLDLSASPHRQYCGKYMCDGLVSGEDDEDE